MKSARPTAVAVLELACRIVVGGILVWAGLSKAFDRQSFSNAIDGYRMLPHGLVSPVALALPWLEVLMGALLILGLFTRFAAVGSAVLVGFFVVALVQAKARGLQIDCGCFGGGGPGQGIGWWDILRDLALMGAALFVAWRPKGVWGLDELVFAEEASR
jgi:uncharacterized membrane protein YphA (DoxX/SURF4 family)